jgi:hypothetical protein
MSQSIALQIPFSQKDRAKDLARKAGVRLTWSKEGGWVVLADSLPELLAEFYPAAPVSLAIPYDEKDEAKAAAQAAGGRLTWSKDGGWVFLGSRLPDSLARYRRNSVDAEALAPQMPKSGVAALTATTTTPRHPAAARPATPQPLELQAPAGRSDSLRASVATRADTKPPEARQGQARQAEARPAETRSTPQNARLTFVLDIPYPLRDWAKEHNVRWHPEARTHIWTGSALPSFLKRFQPEPFSLEAALQRRMCPAIRIEAKSDEPPFIPKEHQHEAADVISKAYLEERVGYLIADGVGVGKTISVWLSILKTDAKTVVIVGPLSVVANWRETILRLGDGGKEIVLLNYERLQKLFDPSAKDKATPAKRRKTRSKRLAKSGALKFDFDLSVFDEAHRLKNPEAQRTKFGERIVADTDFTIWMSATAGQNPLELNYLAPLLGEATGDDVADLADFEKWCAAQGLSVSRGKFGKWYWAGKDSKTVRMRDCDAIGKILYDPKKPVAIRRLPQDIDGWPELNRIVFPVDLSDDARTVYRALFDEYKSASKEARQTKKTQNGLVAQLRFRQKASLLRVPTTIDHVDGLLQNDMRVAVSVQFLETIDQLALGLKKLGYKTTTFTGSLSASDRERNRLQFQKGDADIIFYTVEEGISLHQGQYPESEASRLQRVNVIHDLRWSAIQMAQIEGRTWRNGMYTSAYWMLAQGTVETRIAHVVADRIKTMGLINGDEDDGLLDHIESLCLETS